MKPEVSDINKGAVKLDNHRPITGRTMTIEQLEMIASQLRHMDIIEEQLFDAQIQLKKQREDLEDIITELIKENR